MTEQTPQWEKIHNSDESWRTKLIGGLSEEYVMPRYAELFEKYLSRPGKSTFLELGAGNGEMAKLIQSRRFEFVGRYVASENFQEGVDWLKQQGLEAEVVNAEKLPFEDASFDVVHCFDVMHHVDHPEKMAYEMMRTAKGRLFLTESNGLSIGRKLMELTPGHKAAGERSYTPGEYKSFFEQSPFSLTYFEIHPFVFPIRAPKALLKAEIAFNKLIEKIPFLNWQCSNVYIYVEYERVIAK